MSKFLAPSAEHIFWPPAQGQRKDQPTADSRWFRRSSSSVRCAYDSFTGLSADWFDVDSIPRSLRGPGALTPLFLGFNFWPRQHVLHNSHNFSLRPALFPLDFGSHIMVMHATGDWFSLASWKSIKHCLCWVKSRKRTAWGLEYGKELFRLRQNLGSFALDWTVELQNA